ncbi:DUF6924 domain-containing protein [Streptomyces aculeolatus]
MALPQADDLSSVVLRTDFRDEATWSAVQAAIEAASEHSVSLFFSDPQYNEVAIDALLREEAEAVDDEKNIHVFLADRVTMEDASFPLLAVDLDEEPGRSFRVPVRWYPMVSANLALANMDFADYADAADSSEVYRGFGH